MYSCRSWNMLSEGFLTTLLYRRDSVESPANAQLKIGEKSPSADNRFSRSPLTPRSAKAGRQMAPGHPRTDLITVPGSACSALPGGTSVDEYWGLELYRSWCCPSVCKDYPDMQLRGDQLGDRSSQSRHWVAPSDDWHPMLRSQDLGDMEALPGPEAPGDPLPWLPNPPHPHSDRYMEMDTSLQALDSMRGLDRLSNSMLNGYLENKLLEVYRQHLQDSLARAGSSVSPGMVVPTGMAGSPVAMPNSAQWVSQGERPAPDSIHYLSTCSLPSNSQFSSPELRISDIQPNLAESNK